MKLEQSFEVQAPIDEVWAALIDLERVAPCLPGAAITQRDEDGTYHGTFQVKLGPATAAYRGTIKIEETDEAAHRATLKARGTDKRGQGGASATIVNTLVEAGGATRVDAVTDFSITGRLAAFGRGGMMQDISNRLMRDFATCLQSRLGSEPPVAVAPTGAEVTAGDAAPESVVAADPVDADGPPDVPAAAPADPGPAATAAPPMGGGPHAAPAGSTPPAARPDPPAAAPPASINGLSLFFSVLWERIRRLFGRG
jgi:carbon monoxide dehydrogenase subunit G